MRGTGSIHPKAEREARIRVLREQLNLARTGRQKASAKWYRTFTADDLGGRMATSPRSEPSKSDLHDLDIYCSDANCPYCKDLRVAREQWKREQERRKRTDAA